MINFNEDEVNFIKSVCEGVMDIWNNGTKEELKRYITECTGSCLETVLSLENNNWESLKLINTNPSINEHVKDFCIDAQGMWYWNYIDCDTAQEVFKYMKDINYCNIYVKIYRFDDDDE
ncbi:hypothetical protein LL033_11895 [Clostridium estertheticum]|uniref:hypothetical protein n=1 Tax=Clostridium estertheticum TaxID=238834 RepID=UPI001C0BD313|nr:hypothetical protein [Clostridium estertheticum]MBU3215854.1 hypothetical protein [Clostridium estertheticum]WAG57809.1 hypothetical protein LL033_11895 [Clostridium estertheticum]